MQEGARTRGERLQIMLTPDELVLIDDFRFKHRMPSRAAAVRENAQLRPRYGCRQRRSTRLNSPCRALMSALTQSGHFLRLQRDLALRDSGPVTALGVIETTANPTTCRL
jgi:hypothetical protein